MKLRDYQLTAIESVRSAYRAGSRAPLLVAPCGAGKTIIFAFISAETSRRGKRVTILVHRQELVEQVSRALSEFDIAHGIVSPSYRPQPHHAVQVASVFSLVRRLDRYHEPDLLVIDESHHAIPRSTFGTVIGHYPRARRLGVTATPARLSGEGLGDLFDTLILGPTTAQLIDGGYLARPRIFAPPTIDVSGLHSRGGDYEHGELEGRVDRPTVTGDAIQHYLKLAPGRRAVVFCVSIEHARHMAASARAAGINAITIDGTLDREIRSGIIADFAVGKIQWLVSVDLLSEGYDCPGIEVGIFLRPTQSLGLYRQQLGRVLRTAPGKTEALCLDHAGNVFRHGLPTEEPTWSLAGAPDRRTASTDDAPSVRVCPRCFAAQVSGRRLCQHCGYDFPVESRVVKQAEGELAELTPEEILRRARMRVARQEQGRAESLEALIEVGRRRGMRDPAGWARHVIEARMAKRVREGT